MQLRARLLLAVLPATLVGCRTAPAPVPPPPEQLDLVAEPAARPPEHQPAPPAIPAERLETLRDNFGRIHFEFDSDALTEESRDVLQANAVILRRHQGVRVTLEGHTDGFGTEEYNVALGERRARAARRYLVRLGVPEAQLAVVTFGKERPLVGPGSKDDEAPNRRAEFVVVAGGGEAGSSTEPGLEFRIRAGQGPLPSWE